MCVCVLGGAFFKGCAFVFITQHVYSYFMYKNNTILVSILDDSNNFVKRTEMKMNTLYSY